jgi:hypothetical protein
MTATAGGTAPRKPAARRGKAKEEPTAAERVAAALPHPVPPREETLSQGRQEAGAESDTEADKVMLPDGFSFEPLDLGDDEKAPDPVRVNIFKRNGTWHTIWANPPMNIGMEFSARVLRGNNRIMAEFAATDWLLGELLGSDGRDALMGIRTTDGKQYAKVVAIAHRIATGPLEVPKDAGSE